MTEQSIVLMAKICSREHGGDQNKAEVYGHWGDKRNCLRIDGTDVWIYDVVPAVLPVNTTHDLKEGNYTYNPNTNKWDVKW